MCGKFILPQQQIIKRAKVSDIHLLQDYFQTAFFLDDYQIRVKPGAALQTLS